MNSAPDKAKDIFLIAVEQHTPDQWPSYLDEVCGEDPELRRRVELLLEAHQGDESLLDSPAIDPPATELQAITEKPGTQIGPYKLLQQIGEGGMGVVYMAEQKEPVKRRVALKIIKPGMDTRQVIARFEAERQALAMMDHPNIAKVLDAGATDSGRPYFVMELVNGISVTKYCDEQHLTPKERLELFLPICQAVQHAHQKGIIHRDLKPSNVMIALYDDRAVPKVIDFGVAKATSQTLTEKTMFTQLGQIVGTLEYMSPEQAQRNQLDIDTRSDIYSLGVLLYELLTGDTPFDRQRLRSAAFDEMLRIIREEEPLKPSTKVSGSESLASIAANRKIEPAKLSLLVRGELDWIVMKALEKDRGRRYATATNFAEDIQHYLNDEAVVACPPSARYRFRKFVTRHRPLIGASAAVTAALVFGLVGTTWQAIRATKAEQTARAESFRADREARRATLEAEHAVSEARAAVRSRDRANMNQQLALRALDEVYLEAIGGERLLGMAVHNEDVEETRAAELSANEKRLLEIGLDLYERISRQNIGSESAKFQAATAFFRVGALKSNLYDDAGADAGYQRAMRLLDELIDSHADHAAYVKLHAEVHLASACLATWYSDAKLQFLDAIEVLNKAITLIPADADLRTSRGWAHYVMGEFSEAAQDYEKSVELDPTSAARHYFLSHALFAAPPPVRDVKRAIAHAQDAVELTPNANHLAFLGRLHAQTTGDRDHAFAAFDRSMQYEPDTYFAAQQRCIGLYYLNEPEQALEEIERALRQPRERTTVSPFLSPALRWRGLVYAKLGRVDEASADFVEAEKQSTNPIPFFLLRDRAHLYSSLGNHEAAALDLARAAMMRPDSRRIWWKLRSACEQARDLGAVTSALEKLATDSVNEVPFQLHVILANLNCRVGNSNGFADHFGNAIQAIRLVPANLSQLDILSDFRALDSCRDTAITAVSSAIESNLGEDELRVLLVLRAEMFRDLQQWARAIEDFSRAIELKPNAKTYQARADSYRELENYEAALTDLSRAIELAPKNDAYYVARARVRIVHLGNNREGIVDCDEALRIKPQNFNALLHRARAHARLDEHAAAITDAAAGFKLSPDSVLRRNVLALVFRTSGTSETLEEFEELKRYFATAQGDTQKTQE